MTYDISDVNSQKAMLEKWHAEAEQVNALRNLLGTPPLPVPSLDLIIKRMLTRVAKHRGQQSRYEPHQGAKECARRIRQGLAA